MRFINGVLDLKGCGFAPDIERECCDVIVEYEDCSVEEISRLQRQAAENCMAFTAGASLPHTVLLDSHGLELMTCADEQYWMLHGTRKMAIFSAHSHDSNCTVTLRALSPDPLPFAFDPLRAIENNH